MAVRLLCKCDYCGFVTDAYAGDTCGKCRKGVMCSAGSGGWRRFKVKEV